MKFIIKISLIIFFISPSFFAFAQTDSTKIKEINNLIDKESEFFSTDMDSLYYWGKMALRKSLRYNYDIGIYKSSYGLAWKFAQDPELDSVKKYFNIAEKIALKNNFSKELINLYNILGIAYFNNKEYDKAFFYYRKSLTQAKKLNYKECLINAYINIAETYFSVHDYEKEIQSYLLGLELSKKENDSISVGYIYNNLGEDYRTIENYSKAKKYFLKAAKILKNSKDLYAYSYVLSNSADNYFRIGQSDSAQIYINRAINISGQKLGVDFYFGEVLVKAEILQKLKKYKEAENLLNGLRKLVHYNIEKNYLAKLNYLLAYNYYKRNQITKARKLLGKVLSFKIDDDTLPWLVKASRLLEQIYFNRKDYKTALFFFKKYKILNDSLNSLIADKAKIDFENMQKIHLSEDEICSLQKDKKIYRLELKRKNELQLFAIIAVVLILVILLLVLYYTKKIRSKNKELKRLNETKEQMLKIFSHDLKNSLGAIINFTTLLSNEWEDLEPNEMKFIINEINISANASNSLMTNLLNWILVSNDELPFSVQRENLCEIIAQVVGISKPLLKGKRLNVEVKCEKEIFVLADKNSVELIIRNLISNAIKFSREDGEIIISVSAEGSYAKISVRDFGVGMTSEQIEKIMKTDSRESSTGTKKEKGTGLGLNLVKTFIHKNKGEFYVKSNLGKGSQFTFTLPISD